MISFLQSNVALLCVMRVCVSVSAGHPGNGPGPECALPAKQGPSLLQISQLSTLAPQNNMSMPATRVESFCASLCPVEKTSEQVAVVAVMLSVLAVAVVCVSLAHCSRDMAATSGRSSASGAPSRAATIRLDALDGLRTLFTIHIIFFHRHEAYSDSSLWWWSAGDEVSMFFMLSGFVQCLTDLQKGVLFYGRRETLAFFARRLGRLCPAYYAAGLWIVFGLDCKSGVAQTVAHFLFLQTLMPVVCTDNCCYQGTWLYVNGPGWFVSALLLISLFYPLFYRMLPRGCIMKQCFVLAVVIVLESIQTTMILPNFKTLYFAPVRALTFIIGMLVAQLARSVCASFPDWPGWGRLFDASLTMALLASLTNSPPAIQGMCITACFTLVCISCAGMAAYDSNNNKSGSFLEPLLSCRLLVAASAYSYGAYIYQSAIFKTFDTFKGTSPVPVAVEYFVCNCAPWLCAILSKHFLEDPLNTGLGKMMLGAKQPPDLKSASAGVEAIST
mmetsp:Transcript_77833/g.140433  ORF Transcript_77833/g.140433 Transcript_77833/m.140433 type:complete len:501 (+) Transcript_77833:120-1622(+)